MNTNSNNINPFYVYTDKNCLYIKNINAQTEKLYTNVITYSANVDSNNNIHICCIDTSGKLVHITNNSSNWKKKIVYKIFNNIKNIKNMRLYIINNHLNIFVVEENPLDEELHRVSHFNFNPKNYMISKYQINNILKDNSSIYKLTTDSLSNFIFQYKTSNSLSRGYDDHTIIFNNISRTWLTPGITPKNHNFSSDYTSSDIKSDLFEYCYSIVYKI